MEINSLTLGANMMRDFEILNGEGSGTLTRAQTYERGNAATNLTVGSGAPLSRFRSCSRLAGRFTASVDGSASTDTSWYRAAAPRRRSHSAQSPTSRHSA